MSIEPNPEFGEQRINEEHLAWCHAYVHVWSDLSRGVFEREAVEKAAEEHWQRSPQSDPVAQLPTTILPRPMASYRESMWSLPRRDTRCRGCTVGQSACR